MLSPASKAGRSTLDRRSEEAVESPVTAENSSVVFWHPPRKGAAISRKTSRAALLRNEDVRDLDRLGP